MVNTHIDEIKLLKTRLNKIEKIYNEIDLETKKWSSSEYNIMPSIPSDIEALRAKVVRFAEKLMDFRDITDDYNPIETTNQIDEWIHKHIEQYKNFLKLQGYMRSLKYIGPAEWTNGTKFQLDKYVPDEIYFTYETVWFVKDIYYSIMDSKWTYYFNPLVQPFFINYS